MREISIPKGRGAWRQVYAPSRREKQRLQALVPVLMQAERRAAHAQGASSAAHGFVGGRSPVTAALYHVGMEISVCADISGWFDGVTQEQVQHGLEVGQELGIRASQVCYLGAPRQGLPTSPAACNLAAVPLDAHILDVLRSALPPGEWAYTRYADDLTISLQEVGHVGMVQCLLESGARAMGWALADHKARVLSSRRGSRTLCGVSVGVISVKAPRHVHRRLRAAQHQLAKAQARGLMEWCSLKLPKAAQALPHCLGPLSPSLSTPELAHLLRVAQAMGYDLLPEVVSCVPLP